MENQKKITIFNNDIENMKDDAITFSANKNIDDIFNQQSTRHIETTTASTINNKNIAKTSIFDLNNNLATKINKLQHDLFGK